MVGCLLGALSGVEAGVEAADGSLVPVEAEAVPGLAPPHGPPQRPVVEVDALGQQEVGQQEEQEKEVGETGQHPGTVPTLFSCSATLTCQSGGFTGRILSSHWQGSAEGEQK